MGRALFHDPRLSADDSISCAHCHDLANGGVDGQAVSSGIDGRKGKMNAPTVFNSSLNFRQFWDGRAATLEEQINGPITRAVEMGSSWPNVVAKLNGDPQMKRRFEEAFGGPATADRVRRAIADFERSLITLDSPFDRYLQGDQDAISDQAREGYRLFKRYGCAACHQGRLVGGNLYQKLGVAEPFFAVAHVVEHEDFGRYNVTAREQDKHLFKVPSLRNVALTAPYLHDGAVNTLEQMVRLMGRHQLGVEIPRNNVDAIVAFLHTLTGKHPELKATTP
ncbi:putative cytochrome c peroxidase [Magnetofaba australis IT-1]|uniref:Putative cytochrome c peroxidase n=1 Tax=Magnetofaba australis IT-1 TaxID=1434232 RepID=A0A1Y2K4E0_9PROT|nr:putative cytochrome c peroxidase [Magnetofaba australis IT-1]